MGMLIDDLLAFSRLSRQAVNRQAVNPARIVNEVLDELKPQRDGRQIEISDETGAVLAVVNSGEVIYRDGRFSCFIDDVTKSAPVAKSHAPAIPATLKLK